MYYTEMVAEERKKIAELMMARWKEGISKSKALGYHRANIGVTSEERNKLGYNAIFHFLLTLDEEITSIGYNTITDRVIFYLDIEGDSN